MIFRVDPGEVFEYGDPLASTSARGIGQVIGEHDRTDTIFVRLLVAYPNGPMTRIDFLPLERRAYDASSPRIIDRSDVPGECETLASRWDAEWAAGRAGVFSIPLAEVRDKTLETVAYLSEFDDDEGAFIEMAYPKRSSSGHFDTILAQVRTRQSRQL